MVFVRGLFPASTFLRGGEVSKPSSMILLDYNLCGDGSPGICQVVFLPTYRTTLTAWHFPGLGNRVFVLSQRQFVCEVTAGALREVTV